MCSLSKTSTVVSTPEDRQLCKNETCVEREANEDQEEVDLDSDGNGAYFAMGVTTVALAVAVDSVVVL